MGESLAAAAPPVPLKTPSRAAKQMNAAVAARRVVVLKAKLNSPALPYILVGAGAEHKAALLHTHYHSITTLTWIR